MTNPIFIYIINIGYLLQYFIIMDDYEIYRELKSDFKKGNKNKRKSTKKYGKYKIFLYGFRKQFLINSYCFWL